MKFSRKISPDTRPKKNFVTKKRLREDEINFDSLDLTGWIELKKN